MSLIPQSTSYQEIQRAFLAVQEELNRLKGGTSSSASIRMPGGAVMRHGVSSKTTPPSGETTTPPAVTTTKGRMYATVTTDALSQGETDWVDLELTESADIISIKTNIPAWVRIYNNAASREADQGRSRRTDPTPGTGLMTEVLTYDPDGLLIYLSPVPFWNNCDVDLGKTAYLAVTRDSVGTAEEVVVDLEILPQEDLDHGGPQGKPGERGPSGTSFVWQDTWSDVETYHQHDVVRRLTKIYAALQDSTNLPPESNPTYWGVMLEDGSPGADGVDGTNGTNGIDGADGVGMPLGGTTGQVPKKLSNADHDIGWQDEAGGFPDAPSDGKTYGRKDAAWAEVGSGGAPVDSFTYWDPDKPPSDPSALDDEFDGTALDAKWTTVNWGSADAVDVNTTVPNCLYIRHSQGNTTLIAALQAIPSGDFTIITRATQAITTGNAGLGLLLSSTNSAGSGSQALLMEGQFSSSDDGVQVYTWTNFSSTGSQQTYARTGHYGWLRIRRAGVSYYWGWSEDGKVWTEYAYNPSFTPSYFGIFVYSSTNARADAGFEYVRYFNSATATNGGTRNIGTGEAWPGDGTVVSQVDMVGPAAADSSGNFTDGVEFGVTRRLVVTGVRYWGFGTRSYKLSLWDSAGTRLATVTVTHPGTTGANVGYFTTPVTLSTYGSYKVSLWTGTNESKAAPGDQTTPYPYNMNNWVHIIAANKYDTGDVNPTSNSSTGRYPVEPVFQ